MVNVVMQTHTLSYSSYFSQPLPSHFVSASFSSPPFPKKKKKKENLVTSERFVVMGDAVFLVIVHCGIVNMVMQLKL